MIVLEIAPDLLKHDQAPPVRMTKESLETGQTQVRITDPNGEFLASAVQAPSPKSDVRFYHGKGGFVGVIRERDTLYMALPGSTFKSADTELTIIGKRLEPTVSETQQPLKQSPRQTATRQAMILGAGLATRFEPLSGETTGLSKPAVPLPGDQTVIKSIAEHLKRHGFTHLLVNTYYKPDSVKAQLDAVEGVTVTYIDESAPSGTAGGLAKALEQGLVNRDEPILIMQGDAVTNADLSYLMQCHLEQHVTVTLGGQIVADEDVSKFGMIKTDGSGHDGQSGFVRSFWEKPALEAIGSCRFASAGFYILAPACYDLFLQEAHKAFQRPENPIFDFARDFFPAVLETYGSKGFWAQALEGYWCDIGNPIQYFQTALDILNNAVGWQIANKSRYYNPETGVLYWPNDTDVSQKPHPDLHGNIIAMSSH